MRFHSDMTQAQIGQQLGISQVQVSRLLAHALGYLRPRLLGRQTGNCRNGVCRLRAHAVRPAKTGGAD
jgi:hypothetical protein